MILIIANSGIAIITPGNPQINAPKIRDTTAARALSFTLFPTTLGVMKFPSTN